MERSSTGSWPPNVGILDMEIYFPPCYVDQAELEEYDHASRGKYTTGLGQLAMGFCTDREDVASMSLTVVSRLLARHFEKHTDLRSSIGRLEVGTETLIDKSKSIKTVLMQLFEPINTDVEGVDTVNACFGGTQALFNAVNWIESSSWDGRLALVVMADVAVYASGPARCTGGAGAIALLIGPNAPIVFERGLRAFHMRHTYDFYKPNMSSEYPTVDGQQSVQCYLSALDNCYAAYGEKIKKEAGSNGVTLDDFDACLFHCPYAKLVQKCVARLRYLDLVRHPDRFENLNDENILKYRLSSPETTYLDKDLEKTFVEFSRDIFSQKTEPSLWLAKNIGNMYTPSLYAGLVSYLLQPSSDELSQKGARLLLFSYGSGLASAMFSLRIRVTDSVDAVYSLQDMIAHLKDARDRLAQRRRVTPEEFTTILKWREEAYGKAPYTPRSKIDDLQAGVYYLSQVDEKFRRTYQVAKFPWDERNGPVHG